MFKTMIQAMEQRTGLTFRETGAAAALWYNEWAKLVLRAYEADRKVVYTSAYAFPMEIFAAFDVVPFRKNTPITFLNTHYQTSEKIGWRKDSTFKVGAELILKAGDALAIYQNGASVLAKGADHAGKIREAQR